MGLSDWQSQPEYREMGLESIRKIKWGASGVRLFRLKYRRRRNEPAKEELPIPEEEQHPARRWVVERTIAWLGKRRSIRVRWCKKDENWMALIKFACAHILFAMIFYG